MTVPMNRNCNTILYKIQVLCLTAYFVFISIRITFVDNYGIFKLHILVISTLLVLYIHTSPHPVVEHPQPIIYP
jgi:hypothetical protein